ncbi:MAG: metal ABC transporter permease [Nitrososphaerota archaeon]
MPMIEPLLHPFMQRAIIAGILIAIICPLLGVFLVIKRLTMIGDTVAHIALTGLAFASLLGLLKNIYLTYLITLPGTILIFKLTKSVRLSGEQSLAIILSAFAALTSIIVSLGGKLNFEAVLFGSILFLSWDDVYLLAIMTVGISLILMIRLKSFLLFVFDEESFRLTGQKNEIYELTLSICSSLIIVASLTLMGVLLVAAMISIPVLSSMQIARSFSKTLLTSIIISELAVLIGIFGSYYTGLAPGGLIVILLILAFTSSIILGKAGLKI